jgi:hypothetical protein
MERPYPSKVRRLLCGLVAMQRGEHEYVYESDNKQMTCRIEQFWSKRLSAISNISLKEI